MIKSFTKVKCIKYIVKKTKQEVYVPEHWVEFLTPTKNLFVFYAKKFNNNLTSQIKLYTFKKKNITTTRESKNLIFFMEAKKFNYELTKEITFCL